MLDGNNLIPIKNRSLTRSCFEQGLALQKNNQLEAAIVSYQQAIKWEPQNYLAQMNLGIIYQTQLQYKLALSCFEQVIALAPNYANGWYNLANLLQEMGWLGRAEVYIQRALQLKPTLAMAHFLLGHIYLHQGYGRKAVQAYRQGLTFASKHPEAHSALLFSLLTVPDIPEKELLQHFKWWGEIHADRLMPPVIDHDNDPDPEKPIKVGYVSADTHQHSASGSYFYLFQNHTDAIKVVVYSDDLITDWMTQEMQALVFQWRSTVGLNDQELAELIRQDQIDILVDGSGHTVNNRLLCFAQKPAPVQITGFGFGYTTGMKAMNYWLADSHIQPPDELTDAYPEKVLPISSGIRWVAPQETIPLVAPPVLKNGFVTFGCGNSLFKLNGSVLDTWICILKALPDSRLHLKSRGFEDPALKQKYLNYFLEQAISSERILFWGMTDRRSHLQFFADLDIALDPFPYNGGVTLCDSSWMGVPTVAMKGGRRSAELVLSLVGLGELLSADQQEYVERAVTLACHHERLRGLRKSLREQLLASPICDGNMFVREVEAAYREAWREWCGNVLH